MEPLSGPGWLARGVILPNAALFLALDESTWLSLSEPKCRIEIFSHRSDHGLNWSLLPNFKGGGYGKRPSGAEEELLNQCG